METAVKERKASSASATPNCRSPSVLWYDAIDMYRDRGIGFVRPRMYPDLPVMIKSVGRYHTANNDLPTVPTQRCLGLPSPGFSHIRRSKTASRVRADALCGV